MVVSMREEAASFDPERFPEWVWVSSLFGRATHNMVLRNELKQTYDIVERELKVVADIQRSLLPQVLPKIPKLELATYYRTSRWAGRRLLRLLSVCRTGAGGSWWRTSAATERPRP